jgi:hypothetical protein
MNNYHMDPEYFDPTTYRRERVTIASPPGTRVVATRPHVNLADQQLLRLWRQHAKRTALRWLWCAAILLTALSIFAWVAE